MLLKLVCWVWHSKSSYLLLAVGNLQGHPQVPLEVMQKLGVICKLLIETRLLHLDTYRGGHRWSFSVKKKTHKATRLVQHAQFNSDRGHVGFRGTLLTFARKDLWSSRADQTRSQTHSPLVTSGQRSEQPASQKQPRWKALLDRQLPCLIHGAGWWGETHVPGTASPADDERACVAEPHTGTCSPRSCSPNTSPWRTSWPSAAQLLFPLGNLLSCRPSWDEQQCSSEASCTANSARCCDQQRICIRNKNRHSLLTRTLESLHNKIQKQIQWKKQQHDKQTWSKK